MSKTKKIMGLSVLFGLALAGPSRAGVGTDSSEFLKLLHGTRALGMGSVSVGVAEGAECAYANPAGLGRLLGQELNGTYGQLYESMKYGAASYATPLPFDLGMALTGAHFTTGDIPRTISSNRGLFLGDDGSFDASNQMMALSVGYGGYDYVSIGGSAKWIRESVDTFKDSVMTFDAGLRIDTPWRLRLGASALNMGGSIKYIEAESPLPRVSKAGASLPLLKGRNLLLAADYSKPSSGEGYMSYGAELTIPFVSNKQEEASRPGSLHQKTRKLNRNSLSLRSGYRTETADGKVGSGVAFGAGFIIGHITLDYALVPAGDFGEMHRISLGLWFNSIHRNRITQADPGKPRKSKRAAPKPHRSHKEPWYKGQ